jgi:hypothetical protein
MRRRDRGFSLMTVALILAILALLLEAAGRLLMANMKQTRWRGDALYAEELARSGIDWAQSCIAAGKASCGTTLPVADGEVQVEVRPLGEDVFEIRSQGRVVVEKAVRATRDEKVRFQRPKAGSGEGTGGGPDPVPGPDENPVDVDAIWQEIFGEK